MNNRRTGATTCQWIFFARQAFYLGLALFSTVCVTSQQPTRLGDLDADGRPTVLDLQRLLNHLDPGQLDLPSSLLPFADLNEDDLINTNDVFYLQEAILGRSVLPNPYAAPILDPIVAATNGNIITITGTARPNRRIAITGGRFVEYATADSNGLFTARVDLRPNQVNAIYVTASSPAFTAGIPQPLRILHDSQAPNLFIDFPTNGATLHSSNSIIAGRVGDSLSGFAGLAVNIRTTASSSDLPAAVDVGLGNNGTYQHGDIPLVEGINVIRVTAMDIHGNTTNREISVVRLPLQGPRLLAVAGDGQKTNVHRRLAQPLILQATQADGVTPLARKLLTFEVTRSDGRLLPLTVGSLADPQAFTNDINRTVHGVPRLQLFTDASGQARVWWSMGGDAGCGNNRVCVTSAGISNSVYFCASAEAARPIQINIGTGNNQKAETDGFLPEPLRAWVNDSCNGNPDMPVTFTVVRGAGRLFLAAGSEGASTVTVPSTRTGHAEVLFQLGAEAGQNVVEASYPGNPGLPATFLTDGVARNPGRPTTLTGLVLDNTSCPIGGAACSVSVGGRMFFTATDDQGRFSFDPSTLNPAVAELPAGPAQLSVDGSSATHLLGAAIPTNSFPSLEFSLLLVPNAENSLPTPVLLPRLNPNNRRFYYGTNDLVLTCEGMEGLKMTIKAGSMRRPDGTLVTPDNPSLVSLNQVHHDSVPMPIPDGASPPFAWTLQPGGATFSPPIQIEYPNMSGLPAGTVAYFLSYNHDTRRFEIIASGHVREDSSTIVSDPGAGLTIAGWGCNCPPYSVTGECKSCDEQCVSNGSLNVVSSKVTGPSEIPANSSLTVSFDGEVVDTGGGKSITCPDGGSRSVPVPPGSVTYLHTVSVDGKEILNGSGRSVMLPAGNCGRFQVIFKALASRSECKPSPSEIIAGTYSWQWHPTLTDKTEAFEIDLSALKKAADNTRDLMKSIPGSIEERFDPPGSALKMTGSVTRKQTCCGGRIKELVSATGSFSGSLGSVSARIPVYGVPGVAGLLVEVGAGLSGSIGGSIEEQCEPGMKGCFTGTVTADVSGAVVGYAFAPEIVSVSGGINMQATSAVKVCIGGPGEFSFGIGQVTGVFKVTLGNMTSFSHSTVILPGGQFSPVEIPAISLP